jgi:hypothetical protein
MSKPFVRFAIGLSLLYAPAVFGTLRGVVFDVQGDPVASARVTAHRWEPPVVQRARILAGTASTPLDSATTDESGAFSVEPKVSGVVEISVERDGFAPARQLVLADDEQVFVDLTPAARRTGRVTANGKPVSGALVIANQQMSVAWTTRTADDGTYAIPDPKGWCTDLVVLHPDHAPKSVDDPSRLDVALETGATVTGLVSDSGGRPVPKASVFAGSWTTTTTGEDGTFALRHVAAAEKKIAAFEGAAFGTAPRDPKNVLIRIEPLGSIGGTVRDANQRPLEGVAVFGYPASRNVPPSAWRGTNAAVTDAKGNYSIRHCDLLQYSVTAYGGSSLDFDEASVKVRDIRPARTDLTAKKIDVIAGTVVDEQKRPVAGTIVQYTLSQMPLVYGYVSSAAQMPSTRSGRDGKFKLQKNTQLSTLGMSVRLQALHRGYAVGVSEPLQPNSTAALTIVLPTGIEIAGIVKDAADNPVAGAGVAFLQDPSGAVPTPVENLMSSGMMRPFAESDATGRFSVRLNAAPHDLGVWKEGYGGFRLGDMTPKAGDEPLKIVLEKGVEIRGRVTSKAANAALAGTIVARSEEGLLATATVSSDGTFTVTGLRAGPYTLSYSGENDRSAERQAEAPVANLVFELPVTGEIHGRVIDTATREALRSYNVDFEGLFNVIDGEDHFVLHPVPTTGELTIRADGYVNGTSQVTVQADKITEVTIALTRGRTLEGVVTDQQGRAVESAWIAGDDSYSVMDQSAENGEFRLTGLPREALTIAVRADGYLSREIEVAAGQQDVRLDVTLARGRKVTGHVVTSDGAPVDGASVTAMGDPTQSAKTDTMGAYTIEGLGDGTYRLQGKRDELQSEYVSLGSGKSDDVILVMQPSAGAGRIHGVVKGFSGSHWSAGMVRTLPGEASAVIGRDGKYTIERAAAGELELQAWAYSPRGDATTPPVNVTVIADGDVEANLAFRDDVVIRGVVTESGVPAPGRKVTFSSGRMRWSATAGEGGAYQLTGVEPGLLYDVQVDGGQSSYSTRHQVTGSGTFDIHIEWSRVEGRVIDGAGTPVAGAKVNLTSDQTHDANEVTTDASGAFTVPVARASHVLTVARDGFATFTQRVEAGAAPLLVKLLRTDGLRVRLTDARDGHTLDGYVVAVDPAGLPVARADEAQKDGTMLVPIADGAYRISVSANGYASQSVRASVPFQGELRLALTPGGTLIVQTDRASADLVKLVLPNGEEYVRCQCNGIAEIRLTGTTTTIDHVAPGTYTMQVLDARGFIKTSLPVTIVEGQTTQTEIRVPE